MCDLVLKFLVVLFKVKVVLPFFCTSGDSFCKQPQFYNSCLYVWERWRLWHPRTNYCSAITGESTLLLFWVAKGTVFSLWLTYFNNFKIDWHTRRCTWIFTFWTCVCYFVFVFFVYKYFWTLVWAWVSLHRMCENAAPLFFGTRPVFPIFYTVNKCIS